MNSIISNYSYSQAKKYNLEKYSDKFIKKQGVATKGSVLFLSANSSYEMQQKIVDRINCITKRTIYSFYFENGSLFNLYDLFKQGFIFNNTDNLEYIVYCMSENDINNLFQRQIDIHKTILNKRFKMVDDEHLEEIKPRFLFLNSLYFTKCIQLVLARLELEYEFLSYLETTTLTLSEIADTVKLPYKNTPPQLIIVNLTNCIDDELTEELEEIGYKIINKSAFKAIGDKEVFDIDFVDEEETELFISILAEIIK
ncbi:MAG: hypothetical protein ACI37T_09645 [Candidatus Gastranaerophilaceae bacterium]